MILLEASPVVQRDFARIKTLLTVLELNMVIGHDFPIIF